MSDENEDMLKSSESVDGSESSPVSPHGKKRKSRESDDITSSTTSGADRGSGGGVGPYPPEPSDETKAKIWETLENDYRDTSHISELEVNARAVSLKRQQAFPAKLHGILSSDKFINSIVWLPHGRAWKVVDQKVFKNEVLPSFFNHCSTSSFMRQVNNWNFTRILSGPDEGAYYHQVSVSCSLLSNLDLCVLPRASYTQRHVGVTNCLYHALYCDLRAVFSPRPSAYLSANEKQKPLQVFASGN